MSSNISHPLEKLWCVQNQLATRGDAHLIQTLLKIVDEFSSSCSVLEDERLSQFHSFLDSLLWTEERCGSFRMFYDEIHLLETLNRIEDQWGSFHYGMFSREPYDILTTLDRLAEASRLFNKLLEGYHFSEGCYPLETLQRIERKWGSVLVFTDEYLSRLSHLRKSLQRIEAYCTSFYAFLDEYLFAPERDTLNVLLCIEEDWGSFRMYVDELRSKVSDVLEIPLQIGEECDSFIIFLQTYLLSSKDTQPWMDDEWCSFDFFSEKHMSSLDRLRFLKRDIKFLYIIIELHIFKDEPDISWRKVRALFHGAANELIIQMYNMQTQVSPWSHQFYDYICHLQYEFQQTKSRIMKANFSFPKISCQLLANEDGIVIPGLVMKFINIVTDNFSDLLKFDDPSSPLCIRGQMVQIEKVLKELNFLYSFVCFVSDRCIEPQVRRAFFTHVLEVAWQTTMATWLYLPSNEHMYRDPSLNEENPLLFNLQKSKIEPIQPSTCKFYIHILQALNFVQSRWYPVISRKYVFDCEVGFLESLCQTLKELPVSSNCIAMKAKLKETLNFLKAILVNLPAQVLEFHLQDIDSVIVDVALLIFSLNNDENENLDFPGKMLSLQGAIYLIARKKFLLQFNLTGTEAVGSADFILNNREKFLSMYSNSVDSVKSQLQTIQKELKCFQAVIQQQAGLQHFETKTTRLVCEIEHMFDACKKKDIPDWCLFIWILNIGEDIRMLMAEVAEVAEIAEIHHEATPSPYMLTSFMQLVVKGFLRIIGVARKGRMNSETVGFEDVVVELKAKLIGGSKDLDVISIVGMAGLGKTTLANKLYSDESAVSYFDIQARCCVSQEYTRKDLILALLSDITDERAKLEREAESELADKLRRLLMRKRYLLFIDDVWETCAWDDLKLCFPEDNNGSRIILTTRNYGVACNAKQNSDPHTLRFLNSDESWMLFNKKVFKNESCPLILRDVGQEIVRKCGGLPLSIILVAGILTRMKKEKHCWEQMATNLSPNIQDQMEATLDLSYQNLPAHLKPCFLYLGVFPEDEEIQVSKLTWLWIAEGFIKPHTEMILEDTAEYYLENLIERNLVMVDKKSLDGRIKTCRVHDLVLEFCKKKAKSEKILQRIKENADLDPSQFFPPKCNTPRRLSLHSQCDNLAKWCLCFSHVKSFQFRESSRTALSSIHCASNIFKRFKFLRVLDFEFTIIDSFPKELTLLRYVTFRTANDTLSLPANLCGLETLIVQGTRGRVSLPDTIWKMVKLRHLQIHDQAFFTLQNDQEFLESPSKLDDLQTLSSAYFSCAEDANKILAKTPNLRRLRCEVSEFDGSFTAFNNLQMLEILKISSGATLTSIDQLNLPSHLKKLSLSNLSMHVNEVTTLSNLVVLKLLGVSFSSNTWKVNDDQFGELKFLKLENPSFSEWDVSENAFPKLEHLVLKRCRYLVEIPSCFGYMPSLKSIEVKSCMESLAESAMVIKEMQVEESAVSDFEVIIHR